MSEEDKHDPHPTQDQIVDKVKTVSGQVKDGARAREADVPLGTISRLTREAPLAALAIAFLLGILIGRRR
jgi:hypothetical protein